MTQKILSTSSLVFSLFLGNAQTTITLQPDGVQGKDAVIWFLTNQSASWGPTNDINYGSDEAFLAMEWTWGSIGRRKSLIDFDLSLIPANSAITDAKLTLFAYPTSPDGGHSTLSGSNDCTLRQITSSWDENTVTWNMQPTVTNVNEINMAASLTADQDYVDIDVTTLFQQQYLNPSSYHGLQLSLNTPTNYRSMIFASSDNIDPNKRPKLVITYIDVTGLSENSSAESIGVYPNPTNGNFSVTMNGEYSFEIKNLAGQTVVERSTLTSGTQNVDMSSFSKGIYLVEFYSEGSIYTRRICID